MSVIIGRARSAIRDVVDRLFDISEGEARHLAHRRGFVTHRTETAWIAQLIRALHPLSDEKVPLVRLGSAGDGGYLVPDDLDGVEACFSPGVSTVSEFERDCANLGMDVFLADGSVDNPAITHERFEFIRKNIAAFSSDAGITMDEWVSTSVTDPESELLLQMDIEGAEYEALLGMSTALTQRFRIIVIEFHLLTNLWSEPFFRVAAPTFYKILESHACVHIHPNTGSHGYTRRPELDIPKTMEFTFLRRDRLTAPSYANVFPHPLDRDNRKRPPVVLPACWHGGDPQP